MRVRPTFQTGAYRFLLILAAFAAGTPASADSLGDIEAPGYTVDYLIEPMPFHGIHGSDFDAEGHLLIGDIAGFTVHRVNLDSGTIEIVEGPYDGLADDVKVAPDNGQIVWTTAAEGRVLSRLPTGEKITLASGLPGMNAIAFHPDGRLFATQLLGKDVVWEIDHLGQVAPRKVAEGIGGLNGFVIADDGFAYGPVGTKHSDNKVVRLDLETGETRDIASGFTWIAAVKMGPNGLLYASDLITGEIWEIDKDSGQRRLIADLEYFVDNISVRKDGRIFAAETSTNSIISINPDTGSTEAVVTGKIPVAEDMALGRDAAGMDRTMYLAGLYAAHTVDLQTLRVEPYTDADPPDLEFRSSVSVHGDTLVWSGWFGGIVKVVRRGSGEVVRTLTGLAAPRDALLLPDGGLLVVEQGANRVSTYPQDSDTPITLAENLASPMGMIWDGPHHVLVTEPGDGTLSRISLTDGTRKAITNNLTAPEGLARLDDSHVLVVDAGTGKIFKVNVATGLQSVVATGLNIGLAPPPPLPRSWLKSGIAVGSDGTLYVSSDIETSIYRFTPQPTTP